MAEPGRHCPLNYRNSATGLAAPLPLVAETAYVIGGLYGNEFALEAILALTARETTRPLLVFNGDFNWFDADPAVFRRINQRVLEHHALLGNVEMELIDPQPGAGCGCAYPDFVDDATVARSNQIMARLQAVAAGQPDILARLARLPRQLRLEIAGVAVGVVHGDPDSLAGWGLGIESMPEPGVTPPHIADWFRQAAVRVLACSHTCLAHARTFAVDGETHVVINNGAAGMPNFRGDQRVVISRFGRTPASMEPLYGTRIGPLYCEAVAVDWAWRDWLHEFERTWPPDSPARLSYGERIRHGPDHTPERADQLHPSVSCEQTIG